MLNRVARRKVVKLGGEDSLKLLQGLTTNDTTKLESGGTQYTSFLNAKGRIIADAHLTNATSTPLKSILLDIHESSVENLMKHLKRYKMRRNVSFEILPDLQVWSGRAPDAESKTALVSNITQESNTFLGLPLQNDPRGEAFGLRFVCGSDFKGKISLFFNGLNQLFSCQKGIDQG